MLNIESALIFAMLAIAAWYVAMAAVTFRRKGLDPTQLTYLTPLNLFRYNVTRAALALVLIDGLYIRNHSIYLASAGLLAGFAFAHLLLLLAFGRGGTQPLLFYALAGINGAQALAFGNLNGWRTAVLIALAVFQEMSLRDWFRHKNSRYDSWVARKVHAINKKYGHLAADLTAKEWFYTLHFAVTESIARPKLSRLGERAYFHIRRPAYISSGIMQVKADKLLTDAESMRQGSKIVKGALLQMPAGITEPVEQLKWLAWAYNGSQNQQANSDYTGYLLSTYPGLVNAWEEISKK